MICYSEIQRRAKVWSCHTCWTVFHLNCIKKWSGNEGSGATQSQPENGDIPPPRQWRCPGCNLPKDDLPTSYSCWCEKEQEPRAPAGVPPHSCGQTCGREKARKCPHRCSLTCHAGPCPPCSHMGPTTMCFCGKHEVTKRCSETDYDGGWSCGEICGEMMPCGEHFCELPCHEGLCGACEVKVPSRCYCGQMEKDVLCNERGDEKHSAHKLEVEGQEPIVETWTGSFECANVCDRTYDCGNHKCEKYCHAQTAEPGHCPRSPDVVTHCSCGKVSISQLCDVPRETCEDVIPSCKQQCGKILPCGHTCTSICHSGACQACLRRVEIKCKCGKTISNTICHQGNEEPPQCMRNCRTLLSCGRHQCEERCCEGQAKAAERQSIKRKQRPLNSAVPLQIDDGFEAEHICTRQCGRLLKCGIHVDSDLCHKGPCGTCREAIFEEISCHCGRTVLQPPLPCGTQPPLCRFPCGRNTVCGHPRVSHNCHQDDESCPRCPFLVEKKCMCSKKTLKNQQCWLSDVSCGEVCGKKLKCGSHFCRKPCHRPGECEDAQGAPCRQPCGKEKKVCAHPDQENMCHAPFPCKEDKPCQSKIFVTCTCQAQKQEMKCGASIAGEGNNGKSLPCNDECARLERNRRLALALNIDQSTHVEGGDHIPFSADTLTMFAEHVKWGQTQEREFRVFATTDEEKRLRFKPMQPRQRAFIHALADDFGLDSESMDPEPHRHVMIWKTPRFVAAPNKTLAESLRIRQASQSMTVSANVSDNEGPAKKGKASNEVGEPFNAFIITNPRFGLTVDELRTVLTSVVQPSTPLTFDIEFLPSEEVVLKASGHNLQSLELQNALQGIQIALATSISSHNYGSAQLCTTDRSLNILRRECDSTVGQGWSRVAAKKAAPRVLVQSSDNARANNPYSALNNSGTVTFAKKKVDKVKQKKEAVVDDWEAAEMEEEEKERASGGEEETGKAENGAMRASTTDLTSTAGGVSDGATDVEVSQSSEV
ncbi:Hypothetical protein R9X50_00591200 [Acrodontium crateriforme]|uniref:R3H domain-containing protein n=1 Tax=Acrodontium crateriforme TaxID=150365 RepID=A0AAQ3MA79_9PEZI|nr:Hypothetical protein R9X50_00591200 [Acrodontium crateriforme]